MHVRYPTIHVFLLTTLEAFMNKDEVISYFGGVSNLARLLGISHASVSGWGSVIPKGRAFEIQTITDGVLKVDPALYAKHSDTSSRV